MAKKQKTTLPPKMKKKKKKKSVGKSEANHTRHFHSAHGVNTGDIRVARVFIDRKFVWAQTNFRVLG